MSTVQDPPATSALAQLKLRTKALHRAIESVIPLTDPKLSMEDYADYLECLLPFYHQVESRLKSLPGLFSAVPDIGERWKTEILSADLHRLGRNVQLTSGTCTAPIPKNLPQAFGCLYVLEGSTLGAQFLVRLVSKRLGSGVANALQFLTSYGPNVPAKWRSLSEAMELRLQASEDLEAAVVSAQATFTSLHEWLEKSYRLGAAVPAAHRA